MRYTYARFKNYIPFYNGLGLHELEINLSSSINHIIVISGINGCGKSSLLNALHPFPDSSNIYMEGLPVEKELHLQDGETNYHIFIRSPITKSGRGQTKASFVKDGVELNPNGNISSFKGIVFSEFDLNPNYISLSRLSSSDRGLADKLPGERKKFMSTIIDTLEVYNEIYKELNKKANIFRSYVNNLHSKIQNIGDEQAISLNLSNLVCKVNGIKQEEEELKDLISAEKAKISVHDPNGDIQDRFLNAERVMQEEEERKNRLDLDFERACAAIGLVPILDRVIDEQRNQDVIREREEKQLLMSQSALSGLLPRSNSISMEIERIKIKIEKLESEIDPEIMNKMEESTETCKRILDLLVLKGLDDRNATASEIQLVQKYIQKIIDLVDQFYQDSDLEMLELGVNPEALKERMKQKNAQYVDLTQQVSEARNQLREYRQDAETVKILKERPNDCSISSCPFISSALHIVETKYSNYNIDDCIKEELEKISKYENRLDEIHSSLSHLKVAQEKSEIFSKIRETILDNQHLLVKVVMGRTLIYHYEELLKTGNPLTSFRDTGVLSEIASLITKLSFEEKKLNSYQAEIKIQHEYAKQMCELQKELEEATKQLEEVEREATTFKKDIEQCESSLRETKDQLVKLNNVITVGNKMKEQQDRYQKASLEYEQIKSISVSSIDSFNRLGAARQRLQEIQQERISMEPTISSLQGQLSMLDSYKADYMLYDKKYKTVDLIRKYTSPSKGGIQSLFIQLYMSKTLELSNQLLQMLFAGEYRLLDFIIDSNEFRIPFVGSGMMVDDISSGSTSQICIIGSIINLVLHHQASSKYNIASMDEVDSGLDNYNRTIYGTTYLHQLVSILGIEQLFVISHSAEVELVSADIIRLRQHDNFDTSSHKGNVIYDYANETKTFE